MTRQADLTEASSTRPWPAERIERWAIERLIPDANNAGCVARPTSTGCLSLTAIRHGRDSDEQIPVPSAELNDLVFRLIPDHPIAPWEWCRVRVVSWLGDRRSSCVPRGTSHQIRSAGDDDG
jgi:hypothetical protein